MGRASNRKWWKRWFRFTHRNCPEKMIERYKLLFGWYPNKWRNN